MTPRARLSRAEKHRIITRQGFHCARCEEPLRPKTARFDHVTPLALGGTNDLSNIEALHPSCHDEKTNESDTPKIAKADRQRKEHEAHLEAIRTGTPRPNAKERRRRAWQQNRIEPIAERQDP